MVNTHPHDAAILHGPTTHIMATILVGKGSSSIAGIGLLMAALSPFAGFLPPAAAPLHSTGRFPIGTAFPGHKTARSPVSGRCCARTLPEAGCS